MQKNMLDLLILIVVIALASIVFFYMFADLVRQCIRMNRADKHGGENGAKLKKNRNGRVRRFADEHNSANAASSEDDND